MDLSLLQSAGLTETEAKVYLTLLELGPSLAGVVPRRAGIHRRSVYDALDRLFQKGLISYIKTNNRKYFEAVHPNRLLQIIEERKLNVERALPELKLKFDMSKKRSETVFFRGSRAIRSVFDDQIDQKHEIKVFGASLEAPRILKYYFPHYHARRVKSKIPMRILFDETARNSEATKNIPLVKIRFLPKELKMPAATNVYGETVSIIGWAEEPHAILIREPLISKSYHTLFEFLWRLGRE